MKSMVAVVALLMIAASSLSAQGRPEFQGSRTPARPAIDGVLDDVAWESGPLPLGDWQSYNPFNGDVMSNDLRTEVRIAYDDRNVYFAFHCFDNEPGKIRTNVSQMDALNTSASGEQFDADLVWYGAGRTTSDGYIVEIEIPLQTLRFSSGDE